MKVYQIVMEEVMKMIDHETIYCEHWKAVIDSSGGNKSGTAETKKSNNH